ncbi:MAG: hypothetical protein MdMp014T_0417 [Treponematales bacterium]
MATPSSGVAADSFTHTDAASVTNAADSGIVTITFPAITAITVTAANLSEVLAGLAVNTAGTPHIVALTAGTSISDDWAAINSAVQSSSRFVILDLSDCSAANNTIVGAYTY